MLASGAIASGGGAAAQAMGADYAYIGSAFIATEEARQPGYKQGIVDGRAEDIVAPTCLQEAWQLPARFNREGGSRS